MFLIFVILSADKASAPPHSRLSMPADLHQPSEQQHIY